MASQARHVNKVVLSARTPMKQSNNNENEEESPVKNEIQLGNLA